MHASGQVDCPECVACQVAEVVLSDQDAINSQSAPIIGEETEGDVTRLQNIELPANSLGEIIRSASQIGVVLSKMARSPRTKIIDYCRCPLVLRSDSRIPTRQSQKRVRSCKIAYCSRRVA